MKLLRQLLHEQHVRGYLSDDVLTAIAREENVPLYRLEELVSFYTSFRRTPPPQLVIDVCRDACCADGDQNRLAQITSKLEKSDVQYEIREVSCLGRCDAAPAAAINDHPLAPVSFGDSGEFWDRVQTDPARWPSLPVTSPRWKCNLYQSQSEHYHTLQSLVSTGQNVSNICIQRLKATNLTGRGGAGFPTGLKWEIVSREMSETKFVICNADESEPGTFKDREILRQAPHLVIEGMLFGALTIGAERGIIFVRHEYSPETAILQAAIDAAYSSGILGTNAAASGRRFELEVFVSPGGYILGEETALLEALEDRRGEPRNKPPYPGQHGLWCKPTLINNVETFALIPAIIAHGPQWWKDQGIGDFSGLKFVCLSGDVNAPGVFEVPMGTTFADVIQLAGGIREGKQLKAFLPGGASSLFLSSEKADTPIDFEAVKQAGSILGTGAIMVFHQDRDLYELAMNITRFFRNESCGKCVPCRLGTTTAVELLQEISIGERSSLQLEVLPELHETLLETSICGLGQVALAPVLSLLKHFPEEIPGHVR